MVTLNPISTAGQLNLPQPSVPSGAFEPFLPTYTSPTYNTAPLGSDASNSGLVQGLIDQGSSNAYTVPERNEFRRRAELIEAMQAEYAAGNQRRQNLTEQTYGAYDAQIPALLNRNEGLSSNIQSGYAAGVNALGADWDSRAQAIDAQHANRASNLLDLLATSGRESAERIDRQYNRNRAQSTSDLVSRGLHNTTVADSVARGIEEDRSRELRGLEEQLMAQELGLATQLTGDQLNARQAYDQQYLGFMGQAPQQQAQFAEQQRQTDTALARDLTGGRMQFMQGQLNNLDYPTLNELFNIAVQSGSDVPYPVQPGSGAGALSSLLG